MHSYMDEEVLSLITYRTFICIFIYLVVIIVLYYVHIIVFQNYVIRNINQSIYGFCTYTTHWTLRSLLCSHVQYLCSLNIIIINTRLKYSSDWINTSRYIDFRKYQ